MPKFIAATLIAKDPEKYGFKEIEYQDPLSYDTVASAKSDQLSKLASNLSVEAEELKLLNPKFRTDFVPIARGGETVVRIPVGRRRRSGGAFAKRDLAAEGSAGRILLLPHSPRRHSVDGREETSHDGFEPAPPERSVESHTLARGPENRKCRIRAARACTYATEEDAEPRSDVNKLRLRRRMKRFMSFAAVKISRASRTAMALRIDELKR